MYAYENELTKPVKKTESDEEDEARPIELRRRSVNRRFKDNFVNLDPKAFYSGFE